MGFERLSNFLKDMVGYGYSDAYIEAVAYGKFSYIASIQTISKELTNIRKVGDKNRKSI